MRLQQEALKAVRSPYDRIGELDSIRALAVSAVILDHLFAFALPLSPALSAFAFWLGTAGVRYFFVISGFVISRRLIAEFATTGAISLKNFWLRRACRILPALWAYLMVMAALGALKVVKSDGHSLGRSLLFVANILPVDWFHEHLWSLSVEEQFYLFAPIAAIILLGRKRRASALLLAMTYLGCLFWHRLEHGLAYLAPAARLEFLSMFRFICCGVALGLFANAFRPGLRWVPGPVMVTLAAATVLVRDMPVDHYWLKIAMQFLQPLAITAVIAWVALLPERCRLLKNSPLQAFGRRSYSVYLWQQLFLAPAASYGFSVTPLFYGLGLGGTLALAFSSYAWVEKPFLRFGQRLAGGSAL